MDYNGLWIIEYGLLKNWVTTAPLILAPIESLGQPFSPPVLYTILYFHSSQYMDYVLWITVTATAGDICLISYSSYWGNFLCQYT